MEIPHASPFASFSSKLQPFLFALLLFAATFFICTRENRFPYFYHPDESSKVGQLQTQEWNYHHPMLMLRITQWVNSTTGAKENAQQIGEQGRLVSAAFTAGAAVLLALTVWLTVGRYAGIVAGLLMLTNHQLFELGHYLKEDTSLLFGVAAWFFALAIFWRIPRATTAALLGVAAALALSGKYLGAFAPILALGLVPYHAPRGKKLAYTVSYLALLAGTFAFINLPLVLHYSEFKQSLDREVDLAVRGHRGLTRSVPHTVYLEAFRDNLIFPLWLPIAWFYAVYCRARKKVFTGFDWTFALFPVLYLIVLSFIPKENDRYFLPATGIFLCIAAIGLHSLRAWLIQWRPQWRQAITVGLIVVMVGSQLPAFYRYYQAFQNDDLAQLTEWLNRELPHATLAVDRRVMLPSPRRSAFAAYQTPITATTVFKTIERFTSLEEMIEQGVTHVVLSQQTYGRYFRKSIHPQASAAKEYAEKRDIYQVLMDKNTPLWSRDRGTVIYLHPGLQVYALPKSTGSTGTSSTAKPLINATAEDETGEETE